MASCAHPVVLAGVEDATFWATGHRRPPTQKLLAICVGRFSGKRDDHRWSLYTVPSDYQRALGRYFCPASAMRYFENDGEVQNTLSNAYPLSATVPSARWACLSFVHCFKGPHGLTPALCHETHPPPLPERSKKRPKTRPHVLLQFPTTRLKVYYLLD
jgi:hypothetical protein